jgi:hypothetical protein
MGLSYLSGLNFGNIEETPSYGIEYKLPSGEIWYIDTPEDLEKYRRLLPAAFEQFRNFMIAHFSGAKTKNFDMLSPEQRAQGINRWNQLFPQYAVINAMPNQSFTQMKNFTLPTTVQAATKEMKAPSMSRSPLLVSNKVTHSVDEDFIDRKDRELYEAEEVDNNEYMTPGPFGMNKNTLLIGGLAILALFVFSSTGKK